MLTVCTRKITGSGRLKALVAVLACGPVLLGTGLGAPAFADSHENTGAAETVPAAPNPSTRDAEQSAGCWSRAGSDVSTEANQASGTAPHDQTADQPQACAEEGEAAARSSNNGASETDKGQQ